MNLNSSCTSECFPQAGSVSKAWDSWPLAPALQSRCCSQASCRAMALAGLSFNHRTLKAVVATVSKETGLLYCCFARC